MDFLRPALDIPYCHHERWDGAGYPRGLKGEQIPLAARAFAAVDIWDALSHDRPYRKAWPEERRRNGRALLSVAHRVLLTGAAFSIVPAPRPQLAPRTLLRAIVLGALVIGLSALVWLRDDSPFYLLAAASAVFFIMMC